MALKYRVALVTGAAGGLGQAICKTLAAAGATVVANDIGDEARLQALVGEIEAAGGRAIGMRANVASSDEVRAMFAEVARRLGTVHILVNNAAVVPARPEDEARRARHYAYLTTPMARQSLSFTSQMSDEEWKRYWDVNVNGVFYCMREALKLMEAQRDGRIVNIASVAGFSAISAHSPHYSASKGAVIALTKSVAAEVAGANIYVNAMAPGGILTPDFARYLEQVGEEGRGRLAQMIPLGRLGTPEEYAQTVLHLAGTHYLVGQVISPNGGAVI